MNIELILGEIAELGATWVLWVLLASSVSGIAIIVERAACFYSTRDDIQSLSAELGRLVFARQWRRAEKVLSESPSFEARVAMAAMGQEDPDSADQLMLGASQDVRLELEKNLAFLRTLGKNAPFVGLLGTVIGIIGAFRKLDQSRGAYALLSEVGEALVATAVGLLVALPASAALNMFREVVQTRLARADGLRRVVLGQLHAQREARAMR
jgi:biopolymer transport protein ExbB